MRADAAASPRGVFDKARADRGAVPEGVGAGARDDPASNGVDDVNGTERRGAPGVDMTPSSRARLDAAGVIPERAIDAPPSRPSIAIDVSGVLAGVFGSKVEIFPDDLATPPPPPLSLFSPSSSSKGSPEP